MSDLERVDFASRLRRWDAQQAGVLPPPRGAPRAPCWTPSRRSPSSDLVAADLACGPGAISQRLLARFLAARRAWPSISIRPSPALGRGALGDLAGRLRWVEADLMTIDLARDLGEARVDAVLSTTAAPLAAARAPGPALSRHRGDPAPSAACS